MSFDGYKRSAWALPLAFTLLAVPEVALGQVEVEGRNAVLKRAFVKVAVRARQHVVRLQRSGRHIGYGVAVPGGILTRDGNLKGGAAALQAIDHSGKRFPIEVALRNANNDIAVLRIRDGFGPKAIQLGSSKALTIGTLVVVVGTEETPLAAGVVSATNRAVSPSTRGRNFLMGLFSEGNEGHKRSYPKVVHHDAPLQPKHFGAPLLDKKGRLVGINVANPYRGSSHAVGIDQIRTFLNALKNGKQVPIKPAPLKPTKPVEPAPKRPQGAQPWLGARAEAAPKKLLALDYSFGLLVKSAIGPAARGGVKKGDVIVAIDGKTFAGSDEFAARLSAKRPKEKVKLTVLRGKAGVVVELTVTLGTR